MKTLEWWGSRGYLFNPKVSFVLTNHNMSDETIAVADSLKKFADSEIIILDDGSSHDHTKKLLDHMNGVNEFVLHFNDLFDVIVFNRTFDFARGEYIVAIQDDDKYEGKEWVDNAIKLFNEDPKLAVLGGRDRVYVNKDGKVATARNGNFEYAQAVNAAPFWVRKSAFTDLGGFDNDFAPYIWHEGSLCMCAWLNGYRVGWYNSKTKFCETQTPARRSQRSTLTSETTRKNHKIFMSKYGNKLEYVHQIVESLNKK